MEGKEEKKERKQINFYGCGNAYGEFSNFYAAPVKIDGVVWPTTEHYFQAQKFVGQVGGQEHMEEIRSAESPAVAKKLGGTRSIKLRADWERVKEEVMSKALYAKFTQHPELATLLLSTGTAVLAEHTRNDRYWGDGGGCLSSSGAGKNRLGYLLMELRAQLAGVPRR